MECKRALDEANGDLDAAEKLLKEWGLATAAKKAGREASQGLIDSYIHAGRIGAMVELNCETDFVARTDDFKQLAREIAMQVAATNPSRISGSRTVATTAATAMCRCSTSPTSATRARRSRTC